MSHVRCHHVATAVAVCLAVAGLAVAADTPDPTSVTIVGSLQDELGCPGDWQPDCAGSYLGFDAEDDVWQGVFNVPAGSWEYKAALNDSWDENYGAGAQLNGPNIPLTLGANTDVKFYYDHETHWVTDSVNSVIATAAGSFQSEIGCPGDWQPWCLQSWLQDPDGDGIYTYSTDTIPVGSYEFKVALDEDWSVSYPGSNVPFTVLNAGDVVTIGFDSATSAVTIDVATITDPSSVTIAGSLQSELGCPGDWQPDCAVTHLGYDVDDDVWQGVFNVPAGNYEYKAALDDSWDENYGAGAQPNGPNIPLTLGADTDVKFYYDHTSHWVTDDVNSVVATVAGSFQSELGCAGDWDPSCLRSWLQDIDGDGIYAFTTDAIPAGSYEFKVALDETWDESYPSSNVPFTVDTDGDLVTIAFDSSTNQVSVSGPEPPITGRYAIIHYFREDGDYGDHTTGDYNDYWGLHLWGDIAETIDWTSPKPFLGEDEYGRFAWVELTPGATQVGFVVHRGDTKDGTPADRFFNPSVTPEIWLRSDDAATYASQAEAQGFVTIHYHRDDADYGDPTSANFNDFWGLHLWGDAIDPSEGTEWTSPKPFDGIDDYGAYWNVVIVDAAQPVNFIIHRGDTKDPGPDQSFLPLETASVWIQSGDETIFPQRCAAQSFATIHYHRPSGDYGDYTSPDFNDFWGLHVWAGALNPNPSWPEPLRPTDLDTFGPRFDVDIIPDAEFLAYILHRGDEKDPGPDQFLEFAVNGCEVWQLQGADPEDPYVLPLSIPTAGNPGNIGQQRAYWVSENTIAWSVGSTAGATFSLHHAPDGGLEATENGIIGGASIPLTPDPAGLPPDVQERFPHLAGLPALTIDDADLALVPGILTGQIAVSAVDGEGWSIDATGLQIPGVLDDLYANDAELGVSWHGGVPTIRVWAPTARSVTFHLFADSDAATPSTTYPMTVDADGVWSVTGDGSWSSQYYLFEVEVYVHGEGQVVHNLVTDPYSLSLSMNSARSQLVDLDAMWLKPVGWDETAKPPLPAPEDISIYEIHMRDFSANDPCVPDELKGTYTAFTLTNSYGMDHLRALETAGLTHLHLLPTFDIATIDEDKATWQAPDPDVLATYPPDSDQQQAAVTATADLDGFNWGYDPWHYTVPEGSYATDADGPARIVEFREMVQALNELGLRVVMDVVYNHTNAAGQNPKSVFDRIVPGYYHRLNDAGAIETSSCCPNTAAEHAMMEKLMVDSVVTWARDYKVDAFRFDLMGHHPKSTMLAIRAALDALTLEADGVDGAEIYLYGEGWNFGEVANDARFVQATQLNMAGTGIGTFNDRQRDAVRGGGPFDGGLDLIRRQGFANGLFYDPNALNTGSPSELDTLLLLTDQIRVSMAGNLADYEFIDRNGNLVTGAQVDYNGQPAGYTLDPQEDITYISKHDNQTLHDNNVYKTPLGTSMADRVRIQNVGLSTVLLGQGVPFLHAGSDLLRSKSMDRDSYDSGDWFNRLDFTYQMNNFGVGLPVAEKNQDNWLIMQPLLADPNLKPGPGDIVAAAAGLQELLAIRASSELFRLETADQIQQLVAYHNTGPGQIPGLIVQSITDDDGAVDRAIKRIVTLVNANDEHASVQVLELAGVELQLHPVQQSSTDPIVQMATFDSATGGFEVPGRTTAVFVEGRPASEQIELLIDDIDALEAAGVLNKGNATALRSKLENVLAKIAKGQIGAAINGLEAFINQVEALVAGGTLTDAQGAALIAAAEDAIAALGG